MRVPGGSGSFLDAKAALDFLEGIGQAYADELAALADSKIE